MACCGEPGDGFGVSCFDCWSESVRVDDCCECFLVCAFENGAAFWERLKGSACFFFERGCFSLGVFVIVFGVVCCEFFLEFFFWLLIGLEVDAPVRDVCSADVDEVFFVEGVVVLWRVEEDPSFVFELSPCDS